LVALGLVATSTTVAPHARRPAGSKNPTTATGRTAVSGRFVDLAGVEIPADTKLIQTSGYSRPGVGKAIYGVVAETDAEAFSATVS
jgi:hypothetical protein